MRRARKIWGAVHRWVGLTAAALFVVVSLSGSFLAFYPEIDRLLNPELVTTSGGKQPAQMREILLAVEPVLRGRFLHSVFPAENAKGVHHVWLTPTASDQSRMWEVLVDPFSAKLLGERAAVPVFEPSRRNIANTIYTLHFQLFAGSAGGTVVGFVGLFLLVSAISGLVLWWPRWGAWRKSLTMKGRAKSYRLHFDLHRVTGAYSFIVLVIVAFTGVCLAFPAYVRPILHVIGPLEPPQHTEPHRDITNPPNADSVLALARAEVPSAYVACLWLPGASGTAWRVTMRETSGPLAAMGRTEIYISPLDGHIIRTRRHTSAEDKFYAWQLPLHNGSAFGLGGRIVVCLSGIVPLVLAITGILIYLRKRRAALVSAEKFRDKGV